MPTVYKNYYVKAPVFVRIVSIPAVKEANLLDNPGEEQKETVSL